MTGLGSSEPVGGGASTEPPQPILIYSPEMHESATKRASGFGSWRTLRRHCAKSAVHNVAHALHWRRFSCGACASAVGCTAQAVRAKKRARLAPCRQKSGARAAAEGYLCLQRHDLRRSCSVTVRPSGLVLVTVEIGTTLPPTTPRAQHYRLECLALSSCTACTQRSSSHRLDPIANALPLNCLSDTSHRPTHTHLSLGPHASAHTNTQTNERQRRSDAGRKAAATSDCPAQRQSDTYGLAFVSISIALTPIRSVSSHASK